MYLFPAQCHHHDRNRSLLIDPKLPLHYAGRRGVLKVRVYYHSCALCKRISNYGYYLQQTRTTYHIPLIMDRVPRPIFERVAYL